MNRRAINHALALVRDGTLSIDADGCVWRCFVIVHGERRPVTPRRAENVGGKGYLRVTLQLPLGRLGQVMAHRLVWEAANGPIPPEMQINHRDLNKRNNNLANLEVVTGSENIRHSYTNGRRHPWSVVDRETAKWRGRPMVTPHRVAEIRAARDSGMFYREIAERFGVSITHASRLCAQRGGGDE